MTPKQAENFYLDCIPGVLELLCATRKAGHLPRLLTQAFLRFGVPRHLRLELLLRLAQGQLGCRVLCRVGRPLPLLGMPPLLGPQRLLLWVGKQAMSGKVSTVRNTTRGVKQNVKSPQ